MDTLSQKIRKHRKMLHMSQSELSEITGISKRSIIKYEHNEAHPRPHYLKKIADALGVSPSYLESEFIEDPLYLIEYFNNNSESSNKNNNSSNKD